MNFTGQTRQWIKATRQRLFGKRMELAPTPPTSMLPAAHSAPCASTYSGRCHWTLIQPKEASSAKQGRRNKTRQSSKQHGNVSSASEWNFLHFCRFNEHSDTAKGSVVILRDTRLLTAAPTPPTSMLPAAHSAPCASTYSRRCHWTLIQPKKASASKQGRQSSKQHGNVSSASEWNFLYFCIFNEHSDIAKGSIVILRDTRLPAAAPTPPTSMLSAAHQQPEHQLETVQDS